MDGLPAHLGLVVVVEDLEHLICHRSDLHSIKVDVLCGKLLYLLLNQTPLRITLRIAVVIVIMVLGAMTGSISKENGVAALCIPRLFQGVLKASSHILRTITTSACV